MRVFHGLAIHHPRLLSNYYDISVIESFHHASVVYEILCIKLFESIQGLLISAYMGLFLVYLKNISFFLKFSYWEERLLQPTDVNFNPWILQEI
jgi:hypothetical protein